MYNIFMKKDDKRIIQIEHLKKYFKDVKAVDDISFEVREGELFAFLGLNGAGKSTTINIICDVLSKDSGKVIIGGHSIDENVDSIKPMIGVVFQQSVLDNKLSVLDNLKYRADMYDLTKEEFYQNLKFLTEKLELSDILKKTLNKLSGGQKRRIDIARALIHKPKILILDEPTTGLDPKTRLLVWDLINDLRKKENLTVLLTTHYMEEASEADYIVIIDNGKIVASDTPINLKEKFANDFIRIYKYKQNLLENIKNSGFLYKISSKNIEIEVDNMKKIKDFIVKNADLIEDFEVIKGKMDNVFFKCNWQTTEGVLI